MTIEFQKREEGLTETKIRFDVKESHCGGTGKKTLTGTEIVESESCTKEELKKATETIDATKDFDPTFREIGRNTKQIIGDADLAVKAGGAILAGAGAVVGNPPLSETGLELVGI